MARPSNQSILKALQKEVERSRRWRQQEKCDDLWRRMRDLYRGRHYNAVTKSDRLIINMAFSTINVIAPSIAVNSPKITINARHPDHADSAVIAEEVINYEWRVNKFQQEFRAATNDKLIVGHGWLKVGYKFVSDQPVSPAVEDDDGKSDIVVEGSEVPEDPSVEVAQYVKEDRPILERVSYHDIFVDPDAHNVKEMRWVAQRSKRPIGDCKRDRTYSRKAREALTSTHNSKWDTEDKRTDDTPESEKSGYCEVWEFWDIKRNTVQTFTLDGDDFLRAPKQSPYPFCHPFFMLRNYDAPDEFYPMGELEAIEVLQHELNETRTQMFNHRKKFSRKWLYRKSAFDRDGIEALESDDDNVMVPVESDEPISNVIGPMPVAITPPEFYNQSNLIQDDINLVTAVSEYARGSMPDIRRTATEASIIQDSQNARAADKLAKVEDELASVAELLLQVLQTFLTGEHVVRIAGQAGAMHWAFYDKDYIAGKFDFEVEAGSTQPRNESFRRQQALQMVDALAPFASALNMPELAAFLLQESFGVRNPERFIMAQPGPPMPGGAPAGPGGPQMPPQGAQPPDQGVSQPPS